MYFTGLDTKIWLRNWNITISDQLFDGITGMVWIKFINVSLLIVHNSYSCITHTLTFDH